MPSFDEMTTVSTTTSQHAVLDDSVACGEVQSTTRNADRRQLTRTDTRWVARLTSDIANFSGIVVQYRIQR